MEIAQFAQTMLFISSFMKLWARLYAQLCWATCSWCFVLKHLSTMASQAEILNLVFSYMYTGPEPPELKSEADFTKR